MNHATSMSQIAGPAGKINSGCGAGQQIGTVRLMRRKTLVRHKACVSKGLRVERLAERLTTVAISQPMPADAPYSRVDGNHGLIPRFRFQRSAMTGSGRA
jgi:hypothetical protein